ncbi:hypothetical protein E2562_001753 [Oryza meyeriana var. granulata]|uniref:Cathepsin propeptide inhibitor domain-containing protein n=1 Tax=Oryza meyeriana var. granulata TaxID=110450 RepID=A0A6G1CC84_9ORYZ|nr:hypothetical protein E2562_001753 [Oryza meyeriana var. granulata]KAF0898088.1 hypothetical protein E2562_001753 [Oryza meyeriana var. granulata]KAF0898089.1 hypothetical protein E2562_001753 [Oryza meyeriana var. granulata]
MMESRPYSSRAAAIEAGFVFQDGKVDWLGYIDHLNSQRYHGGKPLYDKEEYDKIIDKLARRKEAIEQECAAKIAVFDEADEAAMKARLQDWMKKCGRSYKNEEEKARRYEIFKKNAISIDISNSPKWSTGQRVYISDSPKSSTGQRVSAPTQFVDWTNEELGRIGTHCDDLCWERYVDHMNIMEANGGIIRGGPVTKAAKKRDKELAAIYVEHRRQAGNSART